MMICPSVQDLSPTLHVASLANERVLRGCQEPIVENNKIEHVTKIGCAMVNMDKCAQSTPAAATEAQQQNTHKTCIADVTDMCNWIDTSSREVSSRSLLSEKQGSWLTCRPAFWHIPKTQKYCNLRHFSSEGLLWEVSEVSQKTDHISNVRKCVSSAHSVFTLRSSPSSAALCGNGWSLIWTLSWWAHGCSAGMDGV